MARDLGYDVSFYPNTDNATIWNSTAAPMGSIRTTTTTTPGEFDGGTLDEAVVIDKRGAMPRVEVTEAIAAPSSELVKVQTPAAQRRRRRLFGIL